MLPAMQIKSSKSQFPFQSHTLKMLLLPLSDKKQRLLFSLIQFQIFNVPLYHRCLGVLKLSFMDTFESV